MKYGTTKFRSIYEPKKPKNNWLLSDLGFIKKWRWRWSMINSDQIFNRKKPKKVRITQQNEEGIKHAYSKNVDGGRGSSNKGLIRENALVVDSR